MTIKQLGGVFGRNPTFNNVTIDGELIINGSVFTGLDYEGAWNAATNTPTLTSSVGTLGQFYIVSVAGATDLNGITNWDVGDWALFNGSVWQRVEGGANGNFSTLSVSGLSSLNGGVNVNGSLGQIALQSSGAELHFSRNGNNDLLANGGSSAALTIGANDNVRFLTGGSERMRIDASGNLLVGTTDTDPADNSTNSTADDGVAITAVGEVRSSRYLAIANSGAVGFFNRTGTDGDIVRLRKSGTTVGSIGTAASGNIFYQGGASRAGVEFGSTSFIPFNNGVRADATNDLGVNSSRFKDLYLSGTAIVGAGSASAPSITASNDPDAGLFWGGGFLGFTGGSSNQMRLDSSGNLLVGKTSADNTTAGTRIHPAGYASFTIANDYPIIANRLSSDGDIAVFRKNGTTVGSIGVASSRVYIGTDDTGLRFTNDEITPFNPSVSADRNGTVDLGGSSTRFKDLYLSGGVVFGTTGGSVSSKTLEDYEEGTWTPTVNGDATGVIESATVGGYYTKVGNQVTLYFNFRVTTNFTSSYIGGLPFQVDHPSMSSSWLIGGATLGGSSNTVLAGLQNTTSTIRLYENGSLLDPHEPNTSVEYYRFQFSYRTDS